MDTLLYMLRLIGVSVIDEDGPSDMAFQTRAHPIHQGAMTRLELVKEKEEGNTCVIINFEAGPDRFGAPALIREQGEERCSKPLP